MDKNLLEVLHGEYSSGFDSQLLRSTIFQIVQGIEYCHRLHVIHRDIKPENILMNLTDKSVKICDFGLARTIPVGSSTPLTDYVATRWYRAPELLVGSLTYGSGVDIFAIGCIMAELADGEPLLPGDSETVQLAIMAKVIGPIPSWLTDTIRPSFEPPSVSVDYKDIDDRYLTRLSLKAIRCLRNMVELDPAKRISASAAIHDPYFDKEFIESCRFFLPNTSLFT